MPEVLAENLVRELAEHFQNILNRPSEINDEALGSMPQREIQAPKKQENLLKPLHVAKPQVQMAFLPKCTKPEVSIWYYA